MVFEDLVKNLYGFQTFHEEFARFLIFKFQMSVSQHQQNQQKNPVINYSTR
jgi:hypothetical protein